MKKRILSLILAAVLLLALVGCGTPTAQTPTEAPLTPEQQILQERRDAAEAIMRAMGTVLWRATEDIDYTLQRDSTFQESATNKQMSVKAGRLYRGIPYSFGYCDLPAFLGFAGEPENGIYPVSGLEWQALSGGSGDARVGNDCSSALITAWNSIGANIPVKTTKYMCADYGFLPVGEYVSDPSVNDETHTVTIADNGGDVMFAAYALLQKADGIVRRKGTSGHCRMIVSNETVYREDGSIDSDQSYIIALEQTSTLFKYDKKVYDEQLGEDVYLVYGVDVKYTYSQLFADGYLPITCQVLIDPSPIPEAQVTDSITDHSFDTLTEGVISTNWLIGTVTMTITDVDGNTVQQGTLTSQRTQTTAFSMSDFLNAKPQAVLGSIDPKGLQPGNYHCKVECRLLNGEVFTVRDFDFTA